MKVRTTSEDFYDVETIEISIDSERIHLVFVDNKPTKTIEWDTVIQILA